MTDEALKKKLGATLAKRCETLLVERTHFMLKAFTHQQMNAWGHFTGPMPICRQNSVAGHRWFTCTIEGEEGPESPSQDQE